MPGSYAPAAPAGSNTSGEIAAALGAGAPGSKYALKDGTQLEIVEVWNSALKMPCKRYRITTGGSASALYYIGCQSTAGWQTIRDVTMAAPQG